ncbi:MAG: PAS domain-containing protein [Verrucomicrobia bacterium]|nr:PAS domain-containing protein [Verrucomicrobiota bacterium]
MSLILRWSRTCLGTFLVTLATVCASAASPKRVLLIHTFGRDFAPYNTFSGVLRSELASRSSGAVDVFEVSLDSAVVADTAQEGPLVNYLAALSAERLFDLVIPVGGPAVQFAQRHRQALFPRTPLLIAATDQRHIRQATLTPNDAVVAARIDPFRVAQTILQVLPQTTNVVVIAGASPLERFWLNEIRDAWQPLTNRVSLQALNELPFAGMLQRCAALPPRSAIFYAVMIMDADGVPQWEEGALTRLHDVANAPLFGVFQTQLGRGIVGGPLVDMEEMGRTTAKVATRILRGAAPAELRLPPQEMGAPQFDWRELQRWGIRGARLPADSMVRFRQPGVWERYWWLVGGGALFGAVEAALIVGLLVNRAKRHQGEAVAKLIADLSSRFINLPADKVDPEIEVAQRRICEGMGLDVSALWQWTDGSPRYFRMTHLYRPLGGPPIPERFDAQEVFPWCLKQLLAGKAIPVSSMDALPPDAGRDRESWLHFGVKSNLTFPLMTEGGQLIGGLSFNTVQKARSWPEEFVTRLELVAQIFANALARKRADQELRESEARLNLAADAAAAGLWRLDLATQSFWVTNKARELFAFGADEVVTFDYFLSLVHPGDQEMVRQQVQQVVQSRGEIQVEYRILRPSGCMRWMQSQGRVHVSSSGQPDYLMGVTVDITDRRQAELETLRLRGNLAHLTRVNTLGALSGSLAHELNQPLGIILSNAQAAQELLTQDPPDTAEVQAILADIVKADCRAGEVIERLRALFKGGQASLQKLSLNAVIEEVLRLIHAEILSRGVTVIRELASDLPPVLGDRVQLQQLALNLILNAADAMAGNAPGTRRLHLRTTLHLNQVRASVRDEGGGLPTDLERLFQPLYTTKPQGLGMGLAICRSIVNAHNGRLWAEPHPERGAVFYFELPLDGAAAKS